MKDNRKEGKAEHRGGEEERKRGRGSQSTVRQTNERSNIAADFRTTLSRVAPCRRKGKRLPSGKPLFSKCELPIS